MPSSELNREFTDILSLEIPDFSKRRKSFLEITGYPHYEEVLSNMLEFYFKKNEEHNFGGLFLDSLLELIGDQKHLEMDFDDWMVRREVETDKGNSIDILIETDSSDDKDRKAIIIENKVRHSSVNPFEDYWNSVRAKKGNKIGVLLTLRTETPPENFINILHKDFFEKVINNIGSHYINSDDRHLLFLKDLYININQLSGGSDMKDLLKFYLDHGSKFEKIVDMRKQVVDELFNGVKSIDFGLTEEKGNSDDRMEVYSWIDKEHTMWINFKFVEIFTEKRISIKIEGYTKQFDFRKLSRDDELINCFESKGISHPEFKEKRAFKLAFKKYPITDEDILNLKDLVEKKYSEDWKPPIDIILKKMQHTRK